MNKKRKKKEVKHQNIIIIIINTLHILGQDLHQIISMLN